MFEISFPKKTRRVDHIEAVELVIRLPEVAISQEQLRSS